MTTLSLRVRMFVLVIAIALSAMMSACGGGKLNDGGAYNSCGDITSCVTVSPAKLNKSPLIATLNSINDQIK